MSGRVILVPTPISESTGIEWIAPVLFGMLKSCSYYYVENIRTSRRFLASLNLGIHIDNLHFTEMDKHGEAIDLETVFLPVWKGENIAVLSEAGLPCLADPGSEAVNFAHKNGFEVIALPGISSITSALISSGFNGQQFTFHGYLPIEKVEKKRFVLNSYDQVLKNGYTQIFIETPYRSDKLLKELMEWLPEKSWLYIGADLAGKGQISKSKTIADWKKNSLTLGKVPTVFILGEKRKYS